MAPSGEMFGRIKTYVDHSQCAPPPALWVMRALSCSSSHLLLHLPPATTPALWTVRLVNISHKLPWYLIQDLWTASQGDPGDKESEEAGGC